MYGKKKYIYLFLVTLQTDKKRGGGRGGRGRGGSRN